MLSQERKLSSPGPGRVAVGLIAVMLLPSWAETPDRPGKEDAARLEAPPRQAAVKADDEPFGPLAADAAQKPLSLEVEVRGLDGQSAQQSQIMFWRAVGAASAEPSMALRIDEEPLVWRDPMDGRIWETFAGCGVGWEWWFGPEPMHGRAWEPFAGVGSRVRGLTPGYYRVTVALGPDLRAIGVSDPIHLDGTRDYTVVAVNLQDGPSLSIAVADAATGRPVEDAQVLLTRPDGLPVTEWSGAPWARWTKGGKYRFEHLAPGTYTLKAGRVARVFGDQEYVQDEGLLRIDLVAGTDKEAKVLLRPVELSSEETARRWRFIAAGRVTDRNGRGMRGVVITAFCGSGTLILSGRTTSGADGKYLLRFDTGVGLGRMLRDTSWLLCGTVSAARLGYFEKNLNQQGDLLLCRDEPLPDSPWYDRRAQVILPGQTRRIDFVMLPVAIVEGTGAGNER